jgi:2-(1,2-epoxy-1,2-dihydrophenyl)acetyl-CoA isomerase
VSVERSDAEGVMIVRIERPETMNAIDVELVRILGDDLNEVVTTTGVKGVVISGRGRAFCAGVDLHLVRSALSGDPRAALDPLLDLLDPLVLRFRQLPFPTVAALEGPAVGVGMSLALATDMRIAGRSASLIPGYLRIGASPDGGLSAALSRAVGGARALSLLIRNHTLKAEELLSLGLVEQVADDGSAETASVQLLADLGPISPMALTRARALIDTAWSSSLEVQLAHERTCITELWDSSDYKEGVTAFLEKRPPIYTGT